MNSPAEPGLKMLGMATIREAEARVPDHLAPDAAIEAGCALAERQNSIAAEIA